MVGERTVIQSYNGCLRVFEPVAVPVAGVTTVENVPHAPIPHCSRVALIVISVNTPVPTVPVRIHSHLHVYVSAERTAP